MCEDVEIHYMKKQHNCDNSNLDKNYIHIKWKILYTLLSRMYKSHNIKDPCSVSDAHTYTSEVSALYLLYWKTFGRASAGLPNKVVVEYGGIGSCPI
jgi:hypothetical protein